MPRVPARSTPRSTTRWTGSIRRPPTARRGRRAPPRAARRGGAVFVPGAADSRRFAGAAISGGATHVQLRLKNLSTADLIVQGRPFRDLFASRGVTFVGHADGERGV